MDKANSSTLILESHGKEAKHEMQVIRINTKTRQSSFKHSCPSSTKPSCSGKFKVYGIALAMRGQILVQNLSE